MNVKRWTVCLLDHKWVSVPYTQHEDCGRFLRCLRCGHESHDDGSRTLNGSYIF